MIEDTLVEANRRTGDLTVYKYYFDMIGWGYGTVFAALCTAFVFGLTFPGNVCPHVKLSIFMLTGLFLGIWIKWWAEANELHPNEKIGFYLGIYAALGVLAIISLILACWYFN